MGWLSGLARIGGYALAPFTGGASIPIGEAVAQGIGSHDAVKKATGQQAASVAGAQQRLDAAGRTAGNVLNQQRGDYQSFANLPFQTLAQLSGIQVPDVQPMSFPMQGGTLASLTPQAPAPLMSLDGQVLKPMPTPRRASLQAQQQTASGYAGRG